MKIEFVDKGIRFLESKKGKIDRKEENEYKDFKSMLLGLSFIDQIINSLKGEIWISGSNFLITIPEEI